MFMETPKTRSPTANPLTFRLSQPIQCLAKSLPRMTGVKPGCAASIRPSARSAFSSQLVYSRHNLHQQSTCCLPGVTEKSVDGQCRTRGKSGDQCGSSHCSVLGLEAPRRTHRSGRVSNCQQRRIDMFFRAGSTVSPMLSGGKWQKQSSRVGLAEKEL